MNLATHDSSGARNLFRFLGDLLIVRLSGLKSALLTIPLLAALPLQAQNSPHLGYVYPAGGRQGTSFSVVIGGQFLGNASNTFFSGAGVEAQFIEYNRPLNQNEFNQLRDRLQALQRNRQAAISSPGSTNVWTAADEKEVKDIRARILKNPPVRQGNPAIAETVTLQVTLATNAAPGDREIRLGTPNGLSNPLVFRFGQLAEFSLPPAKTPNPDVNRILRQFGAAPPPNPPPKTNLHVTLPTVINGQIMPGAVDRFRFTARQGQQLLAIASARELIPYLADAVPGWFQATLALYDSSGRELAYNDDFRFHPDPVLHFNVPRDGEYIIEVRDAIYRGREDFVYRIALGELPFVTAMFPLGGRAGTPTTVELQGWNLPATRWTNDFIEPGIRHVSLRNDPLDSNLLPFAVDTLAERAEQEPNNTPGQAQSVTLPLLLNGRIDRPGDVDVFRFEGQAGDQFVAEVQARRLESPLDSVLRLTDATGKQIAFNDDNEDKAAGLETHHADSYLRATLPATGTYDVQLGDTQRRGGAEYAYRLRLSPPRPDFELRVVPSSLVVRGGLCVPVTVHAFRKDGFTNEIVLGLKGAPTGFNLSGARILANQDQVRFTVAAPASLEPTPLGLSLEGTAIIAGLPVTRPVVPADEMIQAFAYRQLVPAQELKLGVAGVRRGAMLIRLAGDAVKLVPGGTTRVRITGSRGPFLSQLQLELDNPPAGIVLGKVTPAADGLELEFNCDAVEARPGLRGNLIVNAFTGRGQQPTSSPPRQNNPRNAPGTLPAIPFEIAAP